MKELTSTIYRMLDEHTVQEAYDYFRQNCSNTNSEGNTESVEEQLLKIQSMYSIGYLFFRMGMYEEACESLRSAEDYCRSCGDSKQIRLSENWIRYEQGFVRCAMGDTEQAARILRELEYSAADAVVGKVAEHHYYLLCAMYAIAKQDTGAVEKHAGRVLELKDAALALRDYTEYERIFEFVMNHGLTELGREILSVLNSFVLLTGSENVKRAHLKAALRLYAASGEQGKWSLCFFDYRDLYEKRENDMLNLRRESVRNRDMLYHQKEITSKVEKRMASMKKLAELDPLTGLPNRYRINDYGQEVFESARRKKKPMAILIMDIDNFKAYNDEFGHLTGDKCLELVGKILSKHIGDSFVARYGGDEFVAIFYDKPIQDVREYADTVRRQVAEYSGSNCDIPADRPITLSLGLVHEIPSADSTWSDYIHSADNALYKAKMQGKNILYE